MTKTMMPEHGQGGKAAGGWWRVGADVSHLLSSGFELKHDMLKVLCLVLVISDNT
jgi:hypothetical protein